MRTVVAITVEAITVEAITVEMIVVVISTLRNRKNTFEKLNN